LGREDIVSLSRNLKLKANVFAEKYCRKINTLEGFSLSLREKSNFDCIFLEKGRCSVYVDRPTQCRTYPFWEEITESSDSWNQEKLHCPGIGSGNLVSSEEVEIRIALRRERRMHIFTQAELESIEL
jgi:Fe-S-cluster containining protein